MKMFLSLLLGISVAGVMGCDDMKKDRTPNRVPPANAPAAAPGRSTEPAVTGPVDAPLKDVEKNALEPAHPGLPADNTGVNKRDRDAELKTPIDQNENQADINTTANIRKQVVNASLSVNGQNVKIITADGKVVLRGPVASADEKEQIEKIAKSVAGDANVESHLEVTPQ